MKAIYTILADVLIFLATWATVIGVYWCTVTCSMLVFVVLANGICEAIQEKQ